MTTTLEQQPTTQSGTPALDRLVEAMGGGPTTTEQATKEVAEIEFGEAPAEAVEPPGKEAPAKEPEAKDEKEQGHRYTVEEKNALERARTALRRDGVPVAVIDSLEPEKLLKWGSSRAKAQADTDDVYRQFGELKKAQETQAVKADPKNPKESTTTEPVEQPFDFGALGKTLAASFGDEESGAMVGSLKALDERGTARVKALESRLHEQTSMTQRLADVLATLQAKEARRELGERFPSLKDDRNYAQVFDKMQKLAPSGAYESIEDLMHEAATILFPEDVARRSTDNSVSRERKNGLPTTGSRQTPPKALTEREKAMATLEALEKKHGLI